MSQTYAPAAHRAELDDRRYITDIGPGCSSCRAKGYPTADGEGLWLFMVYPGQSSLAQCPGCHHFTSFVAPGRTYVADGHERYEWPTIREVREAFYRCIQK